MTDDLQSKSVPFRGYVVAPVQPTMNMLNRGAGLQFHGVTHIVPLNGAPSYTEGHTHQMRHEDALKVYRAMIAASK